ncbi:MAG: hypothetical protein K8J31_19895 [Anaerolineae bacterium]|nr:hypothetical protein [Anaerolineae bacterium]
MLRQHWLTSETISVLVLAVAIPLMLYFLQGNIDFNIADEGYIWYGIEQTIHIDAVPMRDYRAYDPGRYYWAAAWATLFGDGLLSFRLSSVILQSIGLLAGLLAIHMVTRRKAILFAATLVLALWMIPRHKMVESSFAMLAVYFAAQLIQYPTRRKHFLIGVVVGLAAFFGRNLGVYGVLGSCVVILYIQIKIVHQSVRQVLEYWLIWLSGIVAGYLPMFLMIILIPGFANAFGDSILFWLRQDETNISMPVIWPWLVFSRPGTFADTLSQFSAGLVFLIAPLLYGLTLLKSFLSSFKKDRTTPGKALLFASAAVGIFYLHHAFSRADIAHLGQSAQPFLLGVIALPFAYRFRMPRLMGVGVTTFLAFITVGIWFVSHFTNLVLNASTYTPYEIEDQKIIIPKPQANYLETVQDFVQTSVGSDESVLIIPYEPGLYPIIGQPSPIWDTYLLWKATETEQNLAIQQLAAKHANWIILDDYPVDGRQDFRLSNIYPLLWDFIENNYQTISGVALPATHKLLKRK